jgi:hypothetical protein
MRLPRANLKSLYGDGPTGAPYLYRRDDAAKLLENGDDLPRNQEGTALIGDARNDSHVLVNQMQVGFIRAHNRLVDQLRRAAVDESDLVDQARQSLAWHYQWVIVNEYLPGLVGPDLVRDVLLEGPRFFEAWYAIREPSDEAAWGIRKGAAEYFAEHLERLGTWADELIARRYSEPIT